MHCREDTTDDNHTCHCDNERLCGKESPAFRRWSGHDSGERKIGLMVLDFPARWFMIPSMAVVAQGLDLFGMLTFKVYYLRIMISSSEKRRQTLIYCDRRTDSQRLFPRSWISSLLQKRGGGFFRPKAWVPAAYSRGCSCRRPLVGCRGLRRRHRAAQGPPFSSPHLFSYPRCC